VAWLSSPVCRGAQLNIPFTINQAVNAGNVFTDQLSDASGNFVSHVNIGTLSSEAAGTIQATIPPGTPAGNQYRIRILSSSPVQIGSVSPNVLVVNPTPNPVGTIQSSEGAQLCEGETTVLSVAPQTGVSYAWTLNNEETGTNSASINVNQTGSYSVSLSNTCGSVAAAAPLVLTITPEPNTPVITGESSICAGQSTTLSTQTQAGVNYNWTFNGAAVGGNSSTLPAATAGNYAVTASNGCGSIPVNEPFTLVVESSPEIEEILISQITCFGANNGSVDLEISGSQSLLWSNGATTEDIVNLAAGAYSLEALSPAGCSSNYNVIIEEPEVIEVLADVMPETGDNANGTIDLLVSGGTAPYEFSWSNGALTEDLLELESGNYTVVVTDANGCEAEATFLVDFVTSIYTAEAQVVLYPNPCNAYFELRSDANFNWRLLDISGKLVSSGSHFNFNEVIPVEALSQGMYFVHTSGEVNGVIKLIISR
jgi:hypothetical protein